MTNFEAKDAPDRTHAIEFNHWAGNLAKYGHHREEMARLRDPGNSDTSISFSFNPDRYGGLLLYGPYGEKIYSCWLQIKTDLQRHYPTPGPGAKKIVDRFTVFVDEINRNSRILRDYPTLSDASRDEPLLRARQFKVRSLEVIGSRGREKQQLESPAPQVFEKEFEVLRSIVDEQISLLTTIHQSWEVLVKGLEGAYFEPCDDARLIIEKFDRAANQIINLSERPQEFSNPSSPEARAINLSTELSMYEMEFASIFLGFPGVECPLSASIVRIALESLSAILHEKFRLMALARH